MKSSILAVLAAAPAALAAVRGFNYAAQGQNYDSFASQFKTAAGLAGADDFTSARLYTMIQEGTTNTPISAIQAAIDTKTTLLLGLWASVDQKAFDNELVALENAIKQYGSKFADLVTGISVGSEDLYRISPTGIAAKSNVGQTPDVLVDYIGQVRKAIQGTTLGSKPVGHVDTWNVFVNGSNSKVISACDFLGLDEYPYYQTTDKNSIDNGAFLFFEAYDKVAAVAGGRPIWITEAGWPVSGPVSNLAIASVENAATFWQDVACELIRRQVDFWWYMLADSATPSFSVSENGKPLYDLSCKESTKSNATSSSSNSTSPAHSTAAGSHNSSGSSGAAGSHSSTVVSAAGTTVTASSNGGAGAVTTGSGPIPTLATATQTTHASSSAVSPAAGSQFTGAATKAGSSMIGLAMGAVVAALAL